jgi:hypothetical protein
MQVSRAKAPSIVVRRPVALRPVANPSFSSLRSQGVRVTGKDGTSVGRQVLRRKVNDRLRQAADRTDSDLIDVFCECGGRLCAAQVRIAADLYEGLVMSTRLFLVAEGHEDPANEKTVGIYERFLVVDRGSESASAA